MEIENIAKPHGHLRLGTQDLRQNLYRLFSYFHSSKALYDLAHEDTGAYFESLRRNFEETEIQSALIGVAVRLRIVEEEYREAFKLGKSDVVVGTLQDVTTKTESPLSFREGCNKVIHAAKFHFDRTHYDEEMDEKGPLNPSVFLYGKLGTTEWKARLDIRPFVEMGVCACDGIDVADLDLSTTNLNETKH